jgi:hypothetical protein
MLIAVLPTARQGSPLLNMALISLATCASGSSGCLRTRTGKMASVWAGHVNHLSTPLKYVETPHPRSKVSLLSLSGQLRPSPTTYRQHPRSKRVPAKGRFLSDLTLTLHLSLFYYGPPRTCHWPATSPIVTHSPLVTISQSHVATDVRSVSLGVEPPPGLMTRL